MSEQKFKELNLTVDPFIFDIQLVNGIKSLIDLNFRELFIAVIVHGSVATNEVIPFSDFDGLLIVKDKFKNSKPLKEFIKKSMNLINEFDPLQHHGWFIIYESQLKNYPITYFPIELYKYSKVIFPELPLKIHIRYSDNTYYLHPYNRLANFLKSKIEIGYRPQNAYSLKSFLSQVMLLPAIYYQAKMGNGVFKKHSFNMVKNDFKKENWEAIEIATKIRNEWNYEFQFSRRIFIMLKDRRYVKSLARKLFSPKIPHDLRLMYDENLFLKILDLIEEMNNNIYKSQNIKP